MGSQFGRRQNLSALTDSRHTGPTECAGEVDEELPVEDCGEVLRLAAFWKKKIRNAIWPRSKARL